MSPAREPSNGALLPRGARVRAALHVWLANLGLACVTASSWLSHALPADSALGWLFPRLALLASVILLSLPVYLLAWIAANLLRREAWLGWSGALLWTAFQAAVWFDTRIFDLFRYHVNGLVWDTIQHDHGDSVVISVRDRVIVATALIVLLVLERALHHWRATRVLERSALGREHPWFLRPRPVWSLVLLVLVGEKALYAVGDLRRDRNVTSVARLFPLYQRLTVKGVASRVFGMDFEELPEVRLGSESRVLCYPRAPIEAPEDGPRPNVLLLVVDSLRPDALSSEIAPRIARWAEGARAFRDHASTGNATRFGLFGLFFGVHGVYWRPFYEEKLSSVLIDVLIQRGYRFGLFSTAKLSSPAELRSTAFVRIEERVEDELKRDGRGKAGGDVECARRLAAFLDAGAGDPRPWFAFLMLDSPHQPYDFPRADPPFQPYLDDIDYLSASGEMSARDRELAWNTYCNSVRHVDGVVGTVLDDLEARGLASSTLVILTGDHGEEFGEHGFFGHTSNFTATQVRVPFLMRGPSVAPGEELRPTSHVDLVPTLLELMGVARERRADYSNGANLLDPPPARVRVSAGWDELGVWTPSGILLVPYESTGGGTEVYDYDWNLVLDDAPVLRAEAGALKDLARECATFLR